MASCPCWLQATENGSPTLCLSSSNVARDRDAAVDEGPPTAAGTPHRSSNTRTAWARRSATNSSPWRSAQTPWGSCSGWSSAESTDCRRGVTDNDGGQASDVVERDGKEAVSQPVTASSIFSWLCYAVTITTSSYHIVMLWKRHSLHMTVIARPTAIIIAIFILTWWARWLKTLLPNSTDRDTTETPGHMSQVQRFWLGRSGPIRSRVSFLHAHCCLLLLDRNQKIRRHQWNLCDSVNSLYSHVALFTSSHSSKLSVVVLFNNLFAQFNDAYSWEWRHTPCFTEWRQLKQPSNNFPVKSRDTLRVGWSGHQVKRVRVGSGYGSKLNQRP